MIGTIEASVIIVATVWWFQVPLRGELLTLYLGLIVFVIAVAGMGLMISALAATQQQALLGVFLFMVPSVILSGFASPIANMPDWVQAITLVNPMRYFLVIVRGVFLEGASSILARLTILADGADRRGEPHRRGMAVPPPDDLSDRRSLQHIHWGRRSRAAFIRAMPEVRRQGCAGRDRLGDELRRRNRLFVRRDPDRHRKIAAPLQPRAAARLLSRWNCAWT